MQHCQQFKKPSSTCAWTIPCALLLALSALLPASAQTLEKQAITPPKGITPTEVLAGSAKMIEPMDANQKLRLVIALHPPKLAEEEKFIQDLRTKGSKSFGKFLTAEQWNARFSPSVADERAVIDWATSQGFVVTNRYPNRLLVDVEAPVATIEKAFALKVNKYMVNGSSHFSSDRDPELPGNLVGLVQNVQGLNNIRVLHPMRTSAIARQFPDYAPGAVTSKTISDKANASAPKPKSMSGKASDGVQPNITGGAYDPTDIYSSQAYDVQALYNQGHCCNPLGNAGQTPKETTIAIATAGAQDPNDFAGFHNTYPYLAYHWAMVGIDGQSVPCDSSTTSCDGEGTMDFEWSTAMSNSFGSYVDTSLVVMYDGVNPQFSTFSDIYNRILSDNSSRIMSTSWGCAELSCYDATDMNTTHAIFNSMVGQGWTLVAASGDQGVTAGCGDAYRVQYPSSDPNVVGAGGTTMHLDSSGNFVSQGAWSGGPYGCSSNDGGSTGGVSAYWGVPSYQSSLGYGSRAVPDLALNADWYNTPQNLYFNGSLGGNGGTSIVAPELAGIFAQFNAYLLTLGNNCANEGGPCAPMGGLVNPMVYYLAQNPSYAPHYPFYDITTGCNNNDVTAYYGLGYYCAGTGYDPVTGWGSFNALQLAWGINTYRAGDFGAPQVAISGPTTSHWYNTDQYVSWGVSDTSGLSGYAANGVSGFSQAWDTDPGDVFSEATPGSGNSFYSGPQFPNSTSGYEYVSWIGQGCHTANVRAWDNSGFGSGDVTYGPVCYDTVAPSASASNVPAANGNGFEKQTVKITIAASDSGGSKASGIQKTYYGVDSSPCSSSALGSCTVYTAPISFGSTGTHHIKYFTQDVAGNFSGTGVDTVSIDETTPIAHIALTGTISSGTTYKTAVKVTITATDDFSGVGSIIYSLDGGANHTYTAPFTVSTLGSHSVKYYAVDKAGNTEVTKTQTFAVSSPTTATLLATPDHTLTGQLVTLKATVLATISGTPTGTVTFKNGSTTIGTKTLSGGVASMTTTTLPLGANSLTASYTGGGNYLGSTSAAFIETVRVTSVTTLSSSLNPSTFGQTVTFTAKVAPASGHTPTGTIQFLDGTTVLGTVTLSGGQATFSTSTLSSATHSITASYSGSSIFHSGVSAVLSETVKKDTTATVLTVSPNPALVSQAVTLKATVTAAHSGIPSGTVTFKVGTTLIGTGTLAGGVATVTTTGLALGNNSLTAVYAGNSNLNTSTSAAVIEVVKHKTTTTLTSSLNPSTKGKKVTFTAKVAAASGPVPTGTVTFKDGSSTLGTGTVNSSGNATFSTTALAGGTHSITAVYGGSSTEMTSTSPALSQVVN